MAGKRAAAVDQDKAFLAERTRALALVYLTRRGDLEVSDGDRDLGLDYLVRIVREGSPSLRRFGLALRGDVAPVAAEEANRVLRPALQQLSSPGEFPYPVCLFYFTMANDEGRYTWVAEPLVDEAGRPILQVHAEADCQPLTSAALDGIVRRVERWYDAFYVSVTRHLNGAGPGDGLHVLHHIIDAEANYFAEHGAPPRVLKLPVRFAFALAKLGSAHLGSLSARILKEGIQALEAEGLLGMRVQLVREAREIALE
jgi:hypothetical protein